MPSEPFDARGLLLMPDGSNKLDVPVFLWSKNPGFGRAHIVVLEPREVEGRTLCGLKRRVRPWGDPFTSGQETTGPFVLHACPECRKKVPEAINGGRPAGGRS